MAKIIEDATCPYCDSEIINFLDSSFYCDIETMSRETKCECDDCKKYFVYVEEFELVNTETIKEDE